MANKIHVDFKSENDLFLVVILKSYKISYIYIKFSISISSSLILSSNTIKKGGL